MLDDRGYDNIDRCIHINDVIYSFTTIATAAYMQSLILVVCIAAFHGTSDRMLQVTALIDGDVVVYGPTLRWVVAATDVLSIACCIWLFISHK